MALGPKCPTTDDVDIGKFVAKAVDCLVINLKIKLLWSSCHVHEILFVIRKEDDKKMTM
ncbi:hypothetical protein ARALYDRAFT_901718 [Arabidopsis lyrata subsp. lyrata]|uniref:Uncharacterized protein n=1 Tax=Arabidopsis lyrata subsp. lyrata TaxID=81972 RepID=D7LIG4_ARALL|nr:hypothetical protein ARALYDRAFT_901718 [Arabidopsis lyrata subsp. lyrata]